MYTTAISTDGLKAQAKALRSALEASGQKISHSKSLELLAKQHGFRDWNTLFASIGNAQAPAYNLGQRISGHYLGHRFKGEIIAARAMADDAHYALTVQFDTPVDVVTSDGFSNYRSRVNAIVDRGGVTVEKTSDGRPHLELHI